MKNAQMNKALLLTLRFSINKGKIILKMMGNEVLQLMHIRSSLEVWWQELLILPGNLGGGITEKIHFSMDLKSSA
jgi:hypothetical protein